MGRVSGVTTMLACDGHFSQNSIFVTDIQWTLVINRNSLSARALTDHSRSVTQSVQTSYRTKLRGPIIAHEIFETSWTPIVP